MLWSVRPVLVLPLLHPWENFSRSSSAAVQHLSNWRQSSINFFCQCESFPWASVLLVVDCSSMGFFQGHRLLWEQPRSPPQAAGGILLHCCAPLAAEVQSATQPPGKGYYCSGTIPLLLPHWYLCPFGCFSHVPLLSKTKEHTKQKNSLNRFFSS